MDFAVRLQWSFLICTCVCEFFCSQLEVFCLQLELFYLLLILAYSGKVLPQAPQRTVREKTEM